MPIFANARKYLLTFYLNHDTRSQQEIKMWRPKQLKKREIPKGQMSRATILNFDKMKKSFTKRNGSSLSAILFGTCMLFFFSTSKALAQKCKPDYSKLDKIEKKQIDAWYAELYETSFGDKLMKTSTVRITFSIGRMDTVNFIQLELQKQEESKENAEFESSLIGAKGNEFYFGMKNGDPLKFVAEDVTNRSKASGGLKKKFITTVMLRSSIKNENLQAVKDALTYKLIDATLIKIENGVEEDQKVKEKHGKKMMEKAVCFFNFLEEKGYWKKEKSSQQSKKTVEEKKLEKKNIEEAPANALTNDDVIAMVKLKLSDAIILQKIKVSKCKFDTTPAGLSSLSKAGVKEKIIMAMIEK